MLEKNKVYCWDSLELMRSIPDKSIDLVLTDPPYWMSYKSSWRENKSITKHKEIENDDNLEWLPDFLMQIKRIAKEDSHFYFFFSHHNIDIFLFELKKILPYKNILIRNKTISWMWDLKWDYWTMTEFIVYCSNGNKKLKWNRDSNIITYTRTDNELHPTEKPVLLFKYLIEKSSEKWMTILDPFAWSWTTGVACKELHRDYILIEKEQKYVDICNKRLNHTTTSLF